MAASKNSSHPKTEIDVKIIKDEDIMLAAKRAEEEKLGNGGFISTDTMYGYLSIIAFDGTLNTEICQRHCSIAEMEQVLIKHGKIDCFVTGKDRFTFGFYVPKDTTPLKERLEVMY